MNMLRTDGSDGGPAFPRAPIGEDCGQAYGQQNGMSLRQWYAGQALAGLCVGDAADNMSWEQMADWCFRVADAMLKAGAK